MTLTADFIRAALAEQTGEVFVELLEIDLDDGTETLRIARNNEDVTSGGETYTACGFDMRLPDSTGEHVRGMDVKIDNVDRFLTEAIRTYSSGTVTFQMVLASAPDNVQVGPIEFRITEAQVEAATAIFKLTAEDLINKSSSRHKFTPGKFPALFK